jgi:uncharacterized protein involved in response to NO
VEPWLRPFFLGAALWAVAAIAVWLPFFTGKIDIPTAFSPADWHVHEMIYGYGTAVIAGFLLTAIPNWTGRLPVAGWPLVLLSGLWVIGRGFGRSRSWWSQCRRPRLLP